MRRALAAIQPAQRVVVVLHYLNDLPVHEIAEILDIPVGTVKSRLHYGRLALRRRLGVWVQGDVRREDSRASAMLASVASE